MDTKAVIRRFGDLTYVILELVNGDKRLVTGVTVEERAEQYGRVSPTFVASGMTHG